MTDIVGRLRAAAVDKDNFPRMDSERQVPVGLAKEAAAEIERLRAALQFYARPLNYDASPTPLVMHDRGDAARRALENKP